MNFCNFFQNKNITVMGLGLLGRGVGDAEFLARCGANVLVTDLKSRDELADSVARLESYDNVEFVLGEHRKSDFENKDFILKAAGTPLDSEFVNHAWNSGVPVAMSTAIFTKIAQDTGVTILGVTGTRGKSTVTHMIYHSLKLMRKELGSVFLGGNVRGVSTLALLSNIKKGDTAVLELDSWQLQGFGYERISPHLSVFTNFYADHLNYYKNMDDYFADKANIFTFQNPKRGDALIVGEQVADIIKDFSPPVEPMVSVPIPKHWALNVPGTHNRENAALAREALSVLGLVDEEIQKGLESFLGVEGRLEYMGETEKGVKIYNDNNATTPEATIAGIRALRSDKIILIAGGTDKGADLSDAIQEINARCERAFILDGTGSRRLEHALKNAQMFNTFAETVHKAFEYAQKGNIILFSPMFSSFGKEFKNEYDRSDKFKKIIQEYYANQ